MNSVKRYGPNESPDGDWVRWEDYKLLSDALEILIIEKCIRKLKEQTHE